MYLGLAVALATWYNEWHNTGAGHGSAGSKSRVPVPGE